MRGKRDFPAIRCILNVCANTSRHDFLDRVVILFFLSPVDAKSCKSKSKMIGELEFTVTSEVVCIYIWRELIEGFMNWDCRRNERFSKSWESSSWFSSVSG